MLRGRIVVPFRPGVPLALHARVLLLGACSVLAGCRTLEQPHARAEATRGASVSEGSGPAPRVAGVEPVPQRGGPTHETRAGSLAHHSGARGLPVGREHSEQREHGGVLNDVTDGSATRATDLSPAVPLAPRFDAPSCDTGPGPIAPGVRQLVVVTAPSFDAWQARLQRYARQPGQAFQPVGEPMRVVLGRAGYAWGDGLHGSGAPLGRPGPLKREGDGRSPAGAFALGTVHGYAPEPPAGLTLPYEQASPRLRCVDDPRAAQYNRVVEPGPAGETWRSAERMRRDDSIYELALDIEHNRSPVIAGHGSCIFAHAWASPQTPVAGCTGMAPAELRRLLTWLKPGAVWVALPVQEYQALRGCWNLPDSPNIGF